MENVLLSTEVDLVYSPVINFAMQQNHVPIVRNLVITNNTNEHLENVQVEIISEPEFATKWRKEIDLIPKKGKYSFDTIEIIISPKYLSELTERISGRFLVSITMDNKTIFEEAYKVDALAFDQWGGSGRLPEMLAAFITPNHPEIASIIRRASEILGKWTGNPSFDEYQTRNPDRIKKQLAAIFEAVAERQIIYCSVPASFEEYGQRIRTVDVILKQNIGNCLDLSLFYASCLESVGLNSLVIMIKGHAFAGAWTINESFPDSVNDDISLITKRTASGIHEIILIESTAMNSGQKMSFDDAMNAGNYNLANEDNFLLFLDIKRARFSGIRPIPLRIKTNNGWEVIEEKPFERNNNSPEDFTPLTSIEELARTDFSKQSMWERKLLDLSLRNNLLNLRVSKNSLQFIAVNINSLENRLASGEEIQILPKPSDWENSLRSSGIYHSVNSSDPIHDLVEKELSQKRLRSYLTESELSTSLITLYRTSKLSIEENGANTLYLALGMLKWYETKASERPRFAPILLLPVELIRKSANKGYVIRSREEDTILNITLLEMLKQDFGINIGLLENLPKVDSSVDVRLVFNSIRQAVMHQNKWDVEEQIFLGTFSFNKFIMWHDIHTNAEALQKNKIIASLISGKTEWTQANKLPEDVQPDLHFHPLDTAIPISADSSQFEAICAANNEESFVLHGPPGTGKSQTITNIIANALYNGKKVLFVAEKMAALSVVQKRLEQIGLSPFCLELHSNKSKKSAVLEQLKLTTEISKKNSLGEYLSEANRLQLIRTELNNYVDALHSIYPFGYSLHDAITAYETLENIKYEAVFPDDFIGSVKKEQIKLWDDIVEEIQATGTICESPFEHPLNEIKIKQYSHQLTVESRNAIGEYLSLLTQLKNSSNNLIKNFKINRKIDSIVDFEHLQQLSKSFSKLPNVPPGLFLIESIDEKVVEISDLAEHGKKRDKIKTILLTKFKIEILSIDATTQLKYWKIASQKWFIPKYLGQKPIIKILNSLLINGKLFNDEIEQLLNLIVDYQNEQKLIDENADWLKATMGFLWKDGSPNWDEMKLSVISAKEVSDNLSLLLKSNTDSKSWLKSFATDLKEASSLTTAKYRENALDYLNIECSTKHKEKELNNLLGVNFEKLKIIDGNKIKNCEKHARQWLNNIDSLKDWCNWLRVKEKAINAGLSALILPYENGEIASREVFVSFKKGLYKSFINFILKREPVLASFNGLLFEEKIKKFRQISQQFEQCTKQEVYDKLASKVPSFSQEAAQSSEIGILQRAIRNGGRGLSIRKLFDSIPNLLPRLRPCMLMSPISVAQYFEVGVTKFDLVIFDEASQLPTCEAIGAIARSTNVIVVGDPKQMPPTSFFSSNKIDEDNENEDLESILDDCLALSMSSHYLLWHYRSKHESLIAFSNSKYYENKLMTFPSPDDIASKVNYTYVDGYYDRAKTRQNMFEAKAIVEEILKRLSDPELSKLSIGVVTFSSVQQTLIEDLLTEAFNLQPELEAVSLLSTEPIFIKNLENVQGDERDVILFSIGYGPDKEGKVNLNFGPLNRQGGWRRLNVAVSRARYEMKVFATLKPEQIDITRTASEGVAGLKGFLEYAQKGKQALYHSNSNITKCKTNGLIDSIAKEIRINGYEVHLNIGSSVYKIDIGVVNPKSPDEYILGILCDGVNYKEAKTARDREIVQNDVLKLLGWEVHKVWSIDWWENKSKVMMDVINAIKGAIEKKQLHPSTTLANYEKPNLFWESVGVEKTNATESKQILKTIKYYRAHKIQQNTGLSSEDFIQHINRDKITQQIIQVLEVEAPISKNLLSKRVLANFGLTRSGTRINSQLEMIFTNLCLNQKDHGQMTFFWNKHQNPEEYLDYRIPSTENDKRDAEDLPPEEIANAVREILSNQISLPKEELIKEVARTFGFARIGNNVETAMAQGISLAIARKYATNENNRIIFTQ